LTIYTSHDEFPRKEGPVLGGVDTAPNLAGQTKKQFGERE